MSARWFCSAFDRFSFPLGSVGPDALMLSMVATYSSRVDDIVWKVAAIFHGFVEIYIRGESKQARKVSNSVEHIGQRPSGGRRKYTKTMKIGVVSSPKYAQIQKLKY